jgi:hypothetical protein
LEQFNFEDESVWGYEIERTGTLLLTFHSRLLNALFTYAAKLSETNLRILVSVL